MTHYSAYSVFWHALRGNKTWSRAWRDAMRPALVGLKIEGDTGTKSGTLLFPADVEAKGHGNGWVSSTTYSPALCRNIAPSLLKDGKIRKEEIIRLIDFAGNETLKAKVLSHHFFNPEGESQNG